MLIFFHNPFSLFIFFYNFIYIRCNNMVYFLPNYCVCYFIILYYFNENILSAGYFEARDILKGNQINDNIIDSNI